jgi:class 3 adenylate cyclase
MDVERQPPSGVVTFVLTDVVGSTKLWDSVPTEMAVALALHDGVVAAAIERHGGLVLKHRGEGDSTFSVFERPSDAVRAAYDVQLDLDAQTWPSGARIRVRIAVHTGEAAYQDGDYLGTTVNRAARLRGVAEGGEVLVSAAVAHVVADHLPLDASLATLGQVALRSQTEPNPSVSMSTNGLRPSFANALSRASVVVGASKRMSIASAYRRRSSVPANRCVSVEMRRVGRPAAIPYWIASFTIVLVFPTPGGPTMATVERELVDEPSLGATRRRAFN